MSGADSMKSSLVRRKDPGLAYDLVLLVIPPSVSLLDERVFVSLGILRVAASLEAAGVSVEMLDLSGIQNYEEGVESALRGTRAKAVCLTATTPQMPAATKIADAVKRFKQDTRLIIGRPHATLVAAAYKLETKEKRTGRAKRALDDLMKQFDVVVAGDGELAVFEPLRAAAPHL